MTHLTTRVSRSVFASSRISLLVLTAGLPGTTWAQTPLSIDDALEERSVRGVALSPDGGLLAYVGCIPAPMDRSSYFTASGFYVRSAGCRTRIVRIADGGEIALDLGKGTSLQHAWSPDGRQLAYLSDRDGMARIWVADVKTGKARRVSAQIVREGIPNRDGGIQWSPDGRLLLAKILPVGSSLADANRAIESAAHTPGTRPATEPRADQANVRVFRSAAGDVPRPEFKPFAAVPDTFVVSERSASYQGDVALIDVRSGAVRPLTRGANAFWFHFSPDGRFVAVNDWKGSIPSDGLNFVHDFSIFSTADGRVLKRVRYVYPSASGDPHANWSPSSAMVSYAPCRFLRIDGEEIDLREMMGDKKCGRYWAPNDDVLYALSSDPRDGPDETTIWRITPTKREVTRIGAVRGRRGQWLLPRDYARLWSPDGGRSAFMLTRDSLAATLVHRVNLTTGAAPLVRREDKSLGSTLLERANRDVSRDGRTFVFEAEGAAEPAELWVTDSSFAAPRRLTRLNDHLTKYRFGTTKVISWYGGRQGRLHRGVLLLPPDYKPGRRYPVVTWAYPGTHMTHRTTFGGAGGGRSNFQLFATRGYVVFFPDIFAYEGTPIVDIPASIMSGIDRLVELGIADSSRLGVAGHSQGGYSTMATLTQTTRFKAAMAYAGHYDPFRDYGELSMTGIAESATRQETYQFPHIAMGASPWERRDRYIENNTLFYLDRVQTPVLLVVGGRDGAMVGQAQAAFVGLRRLGKTTELALYPDEGHSMANPPNSRDYLERFIGWFDRYLRSGTSSRAARPEE